MKPIKILQVSDLLVSGREALASSVLDDLTLLVSEHAPLDYLVVCGNLTRNGTPQEFDAVRDLLVRLSSRLLRTDVGALGAKELRLNRLLVLPGGCDVDADERGEPALNAFAAFHDALYAGEIAAGRVEAFTPAPLVFRDLKDLTLIGALYWNTPAQAANRALLERMLEGADRKPGSPRPAYCRFTPTVLCSAAAPLREDVANPRVAALRTLFWKQLDVMLQLVGAAETAYILPEPNRFRHLTISTGPRNEGGFWPFRANLVVLKGGTLGKANDVVNGGAAPDRGQGDGGELLGTEFWVKRGPEAPFAPYSHLKGELDRLIELPVRPPHSDGDLAAALHRIEAALEKTRLVIVTGPPGSGKSVIFDHLERTRRLAGRQFSVASFTIERFEGYDSTRLGEKVEKALAALARAKKGTRLLAVRDVAYPELQETERPVLRDVLKRVYDLIDPEQLDYVVYFLPRAASVQGFPAGLAERVAVQPVGPAELDAMVDRYAWSVPVSRPDVFRLTGGYLGLSQLALAGATERFAGYSGAEPIHGSTGLALLSDALEGDRYLREEVDSLRRNIRVAVGLDVFEFLYDRVIQALDRLWQGGEPVRITFTLEELQAARAQGTRGDVAVAYLVDAGVVAREGTEYVLQVVAPFLALHARRERLPESLGLGDAAAPGPAPAQAVAAAGTEPPRLGEADWVEVQRFLAGVRWDEWRRNRFVFWEDAFAGEDYLDAGEIDDPRDMTAATFASIAVRRARRSATPARELRFVQGVRRLFPAPPAELARLEQKLGGRSAAA